MGPREDREPAQLGKRILRHGTMHEFPKWQWLPAFPFGCIPNLPTNGKRANEPPCQQELHVARGAERLGKCPPPWSREGSNLASPSVKL